jgi:hypothetical protein
MEVKPLAFRATFEGWILPNNKVNLAVPPPVGPFTVEVFLDSYDAGHMGFWRGRLIPTGERFSGRRFKTAIACQQQVERNFLKKTQDWQSA